MTPERIAELRALCDAATPGPWVIEDCLGFTASIVRTGPGVADFMQARTVEDNRFVAAARTALPEALDALEAERRLREKSYCPGGSEAPGFCD